MKLILSLLLTIQPAFAQTSKLVVGKVDIQENSLAPRNHIINPNCNENVLSITASGGTVTRGTGAANVESDVMNGRTECRVDASASGQTYTWLTRDLSAGLLGNNCEVRFKYFGLGNGNYKAYAQNEAGAKSAEISLQDYATYASPTQILTVPCGNANGYGGANEDYAPRLIIESTNASAPLIYVGDIYSGEVTSIGQFSSISEWISAGEMTIGATTTAPTKATTRVNDSVRYRRVGKMAEIEYTYYHSSSAGSAAGSGDYLFSLPSGLTFDTNLISFFATVGTNPLITAAAAPALINTPAGEINVNSASGDGFVKAYAYNSTQFRLGLEDRYSSTGLMSSTFYALNTSILSFKFTIYVPIASWSASQSAAAANQTDYGWTSYTPTFTGFGTVSSSSCYHRRNKENLDVRCRFTAGTTTATEARVSFPNSLTSSSSIATLESAGTFFAPGASSTQRGGAVFSEASVGYFTFGDKATFSGGTLNGLAKAVGSSVLSTGETMSFFASVPISGWAENQRAPTLIGSVTSNSTGAIRHEVFQVAADGTVSKDFGDLISGNCTNANPRVCTFNSNAFSSAPVCTGVLETSSASSALTISSISTTGITLTERATATGTAQQTLPIHMYCTGPR